MSEIGLSLELTVKRIKLVRLGQILVQNKSSALVHK